MEIPPAVHAHTDESQPVDVEPRERRPWHHSLQGCACVRKSFPEGLPGVLPSLLLLRAQGARPSRLSLDLTELIQWLMSIREDPALPVFCDSYREVIPNRKPTKSGPHCHCVSAWTWPHIPRAVVLAGRPVLFRVQPGHPGQRASAQKHPARCSSVPDQA